MKIRFYNLGQIEETELDLKPLTVIIGPNNSNKTYIAYSIYGLWQNMIQSVRPGTIPLQNNPNGSLSIKVETLQKAFTKGIAKSVDDFIEELESFYQDSSHSLFSTTRYEVIMSAEEFKSAVESLSGHISGIFNGDGHRPSLEQDLLILTPKENTSTLLEQVLEEQLPSRAFHVGYTLDGVIRQKLFPYPYLLPAERNAFVITYKVLANRRLKLMLDAQRRVFSSKKTSTRQLELLREAGEVRYPQPIEDFLEFLFEVELESHPGSGEEGEIITHQRPKPRRSPEIGLRKLAADIEKNIQNGNRINFRRTALGGQELMVDVGNGLNIDLYNASSSIKQLAPLLLYLRYRADRGDLLVIDEPEMNLHPESQAKLLEVLAMLVNQGVYVLLTTHSPYLMAHLNNLAHADKLSEATRRRRAKSLYLKDPESLLDLDQISAYEMRDNQLHSLKDPDYGIRWDTLSDVSSELQQRFFDLHE